MLTHPIYIYNIITKTVFAIHHIFIWNYFDCFESIDNIDRMEMLNGVGASEKA